MTARPTDVTETRWVSPPRPGALNTPRANTSASRANHELLATARRILDRARPQGTVRP